MHVVAGLHEVAQQHAGLVRGNAARDAEYHPGGGTGRGRHGSLALSFGRVSCRAQATGDVPAWSSPGSTSSQVKRPCSISRIAIERGFSWTWVSTSGPTYSSRPSPS